MALAASAAALLALALLLDAYIIVVPISSTSESSLSSSHHLAQIHVHVAGRAVEELVTLVLSCGEVAGTASSAG